MNSSVVSLSIFSASILFIFTIFVLGVSDVHAGQNVSYFDGDSELQGYWVNSQCEGAEQEKSPVIMIVHQWMGLGDYEKRRADMLAQACFNTFAVDVYGKGIRPNNRQEAAEISSKYKNNPELARKRMKAALNFVRTKHADHDIAVIGYCFGGTMALELARSGADIAAAVSFHGGLTSKAPVTEASSIKPVIQVHHGAEDPYVPQKDVDVFRNEMSRADADLYFSSYANAVHAFTEKDSGNDPSSGVAYNETADKVSWESTLALFDQIFGR